VTGWTIDFTAGASWVTSPSVGDGEVVRRVVAGERAALAELYDQHASGLRRFARQLTGETASAEDLVHEVFVALPRALARFRGDGSLSSFLLSIAANKARNHVRHAMRTRAAAGKERAVPIEHAGSPEQALHNDRLRIALVRALDALPLKQRLTFTLCDVEGLSSEEAARVLDVPAATVRTRLHHARATLRELLKAERS
jgi:RNA polymerase sigma-70 factor (ECF subfamily)